MKKIIIAFFIGLFAFVAKISAQDEIDSLKARFVRLKKYQIPDYLIRDNWVKVKLRFNETCNIISYQGKYYDLENFEPIFVRILNEKPTEDTILIQMDYGDYLTIEKMVKSYEIVANIVEKQKNKRVCFIVMYSEPVKPKYVKTDTIDLLANKSIRYNGEALQYSALTSCLKTKRPELLILRAENKARLQDLVDLMEITNRLKIKAILATK